MLAIAFGCGAIGAGIVIATLPTPEARVAVFVPPVVPRIVEVPAAPPPPPPKRLLSSELQLVFRVDGASYVQLGDATAISHGKLQLIDKDGVENSIASVEADAVPAPERAWLGRKVYVDNDCVATVTGFAVVARVTGDVGYSGTEHDRRWTTTNVMKEGSPILAAKLDRCDGTYARSASLPQVVVLQKMADDAELIAKAKKSLLASTAATETVSEWLRDFEDEPDWKRDAQYDIRTLRHPITGETWISIHAFNDHGCGTPEINVWGLFRVREDGTLSASQLRNLGDMVRIDQIIDIEGDGELELIGHPWLGLDVTVTRASGEVEQNLPLPFFGCPC